MVVIEHERFLELAHANSSLKQVLCSQSQHTVPRPSGLNTSQCISHSLLAIPHATLNVLRSVDILQQTGHNKPISAVA